MIKYHMPTNKKLKQLIMCFLYVSQRLETICFQSNKCIKIAYVCLCMCVLVYVCAHMCAAELTKTTMFT